MIVHFITSSLNELKFKKTKTSQIKIEHSKSIFKITTNAFALMEDGSLGASEKLYCKHRFRHRFKGLVKQ